MKYRQTILIGWLSIVAVLGAFNYDRSSANAADTMVERDGPMTGASPAPAPVPPAPTTSLAAPAETSAATVSSAPTIKPPVGTPPNAFLRCVRERESRGIYTVVNPQPVSGEHASGAYQILPSVWNNTARHIGRYDLVGMPPNTAPPDVQDAMAMALYNWMGRSPWAGPGC